MGRDTVQLETAVNPISQEYLLEFTSEYGIPEALHPELPRPEDRIVDFPEGKAGEKYPAVLYQALGLSQKLEQPLFLGGREGVPDCRGLAHECSKRWDAGREHIFHRSRENTGYTPHSHPKTARGATLLSGNKPQILPGGRDMDLFSLIRAPNPTKVKTRIRPRAAHEVPMLTVTANQVIEMEDPAAATDSSGIPSTIERSPLDFANEAEAEDPGTMAPEVPPPEDVPTTRGIPEAGQVERVAATNPSAVGESCKRGHDGVDANAPPKVLRMDHADPRPTWSTRGGKYFVVIELGMGSTRPALVPESAPADVSDPDPLSFADPRSRHLADVAQSSQGTVAAGDPESENTSFAFLVGSPESIYRPEWGIANGSMLDTSEAFQDLVDHVPPPGYFSELRHLRNDDFLRWYNVNLARQVAMGSQLRLRFEHEAKLLKKSVAQDAEEKSAKLSQELENMRTLFSDLQVSNDHLSQQVATLQEQAFADVESARIVKGRSEGLRRRVEHGQAQLNLEAIEAYDLEAEAKYISALQALKNLKYPLVVQLEGLKDAPIDVIMAALHLENDTGDDAPQWVRELRPSFSQLTIHVYPEVRGPMNPWACKEEMLLADAIAANFSHAEKKKKCRIVCRTHGVGSAHHGRSDGVPVSAPTIVPQGLAILLADAATQTESDEATLNNL
nr:hypothetical protein [Tanacetum cinerariifolium]